VRVLAACLGDCVHVAGATRFLRIAEEEGHETHFTGPATDLETLVEAVLAFDPDVIGVSYRLTAENVRPLLRELKGMLAAAGIKDKRLVFAGTPPVVAVAKEFDLFEEHFEGGEPAAEVRRYLRRRTSSARIYRTPSRRGRAVCPSAVRMICAACTGPLGAAITR
jgi:methylmalonyl-CoA mutase cobalamin-binding subunit